MAEEEETPNTSETTSTELTARPELSIDEFLQKIDLSSLADIFKEEEVTMDILKTFNHDDLRNIGITKYGPCKKILNSIASLEFQDQELKDLLIDHDILSLNEILSDNSITTKIIWDLEGQELKEMGMNVGDRLKYKKAKEFWKERLFVKYESNGKDYKITQGVATRIGNKLFDSKVTDSDDTLDYFPEYLNGSLQYQFARTKKWNHFYRGLDILLLAKANCEVYVCLSLGYDKLEKLGFIRKDGEINHGEFTIQYKKMLKNEEVRFTKRPDGPELIIFIK